MRNVGPASPTAWRTGYETLCYLSMRFAKTLVASPNLMMLLGHTAGTEQHLNLVKGYRNPNQK